MTAGDAFTAAVEFFQHRLDDPVEFPDDGIETPRDYFREVRGWDDDTIDAKRLGWAPVSEAALLDHLMRQGFDREAILGTGLFWENGLAPIWQGRLVFPYLVDGRPTFAISRRVGDHGHAADGAGVYADEDIPAKYHKVPGQDCTTVDEPIYGLDSLKDGGDILITEGIADAITAYKAGYACLSPVTTTFKHDDRERLLKILEERDVGRVVVIQDAELPTSDVVDDAEGWAALNVEQYGEGVKGAARTAGYLAENGVDARIGELPQPGAEKVDLDDYLGGWADTLAPILASAVPATHHPAYNVRKEAIERARRQVAGKQSENGGAAGEQSKSGGTALFDLDLVDVAGVSEGYRGTNPLGHHGDSENYYVVLEGGELGFDHKHNVAYNALTHLLVEAGERRASSPGGTLSDGELLATWVEAKRRGHLASDDPVPHAALRHVAVDRGLCSPEDLGDGWRLPQDAYNGSLDALEDEHGVEAGRAPVGSDPVAALPLARLDTLDPEEARRYARKRGVEWPTTREGRERLRDELFQTFRAEQTKVVDAPTALGKSYTVATEAWTRHVDVTGGQPVVQFHPTREARDQAARKSEDANVTHTRLLGRTEACTLAAGLHDPAEDDEDDDPDVVITMNGVPASEWLKSMCEGRGIAFSVAHAYLAEHNDQDVDPPCCAGEGERCQAELQWDDVPRDEESGEPAFDVIHATHQFAHVPSLRSGTNVVFDERPDFAEGLGHDRVRDAVAAFLKVSGAPVTTFEEFVARARNEDTRIPNEHAQHQFVSQALNYKPDREWYLEADGAHTLAPALTKAIWYAIDDGGDANERFSSTVPHDPPRLDAGANDSDGWNREWVRVVLDENNTVRVVRAAPDFSATRAVVGLDAHPSMTLWQQNVHPDVRKQSVLGAEERALWRRYERGLLAVQVGDATRPLASGEYFNDGHAEASLGALSEHHGEDFHTCITASSVEQRIGSILEDAGVPDPDTMHFGEEKSRGDFGDEDIGAVYGSIDPGDDYVLDMLAEAGLDARPETVDTPDGEEQRAHGRGFVGPDADRARELLASVREQHVAQAAGRYARNADDPEDRAVVYVFTDALPPGFADLKVPGVEWLPTEKQRAIADALRGRDTATTQELAEAVGVSKEHTRQTLKHLANGDVVERREAAGEHGADVYRALHGLNPLGRVDLETTNDDVCVPYTWCLAISPPFRSPSRSHPPGEGGRPGSDPAEGGGEGVADGKGPPD